MLWRAVILAVALSALPGCSADAADEPEPTLDTKGAFIAVAADRGGYELLRSLAVLGDGAESDVFFVATYAAEPQSFEEARALAQDRSLEPLKVTAIGRGYITSREWRVVWFRSVSAEEQAGFR